MTDQCRHCSAYGDFQECENTPCFHHENWYAVQLREQIDDLKATVKRTDDLILTLTDDNEKQAEGIAGLDAELAELRAHHDEELTTAYDQIKEMTAENTTLKAEVARFIMQDGMCQTNTETGDPDLHRALNGG
jgi:predicted RNase H-like nuclease (RuvC/YqgF family)